MTQEISVDKIAVLIPCYNEEKTIEKVVLDWRESLPEAVVYVYDNNSTDRTADIAREAGAVVRHEYQQGKGNVIRRMFREIDAMCYIMVDGDDTYPAEYGRQMADLVLLKNADMVVGDRLSSTYFEENKRPFHNFGNSLVRGSINRLFNKGFEIETEMSIHAVDKNMRIENVIIEYRDRPEGSESKLNTYSDGMRVLSTIFRLYKNYKPMYFFGWLSVILFALTVILFVPVFIDYTQTGLVPRFPTLIVSGFIGLGGVLSLFTGLILSTLAESLFTGLILSTLAEKDRQEFEFRLTVIENIYHFLLKDR